MLSSDLLDLNARDLLAVQVLSECKSFVAAAITLGVSQPSLTRTIQRVEQVIGVQLFRRSTRRVDVTDAGIEFAAIASRILSDLRISLGNLRDASGEQRGQLIVACVMSIAYTRLPLLIERYRTRRPAIEFHLREGVHGDVVDDVRSGVADLGITYVDDVPSGCETMSLAREAFHVVVPGDHVLAKSKAPLGLAEAARYPMVSLPRDAQTRRTLDDLAAAAGLVLAHVMTATQFATLMQCVRAGVGIAIVPAGAITSAMVPGLVSRPLARPTVARHIGLLMLSGRARTADTEEFIAFVREQWPRAKPRRQ